MVSREELAANLRSNLNSKPQQQPQTRLVAKRKHTINQISSVNFENDQRLFSAIPQVAFFSFAQFGNSESLKFNQNWNQLIIINDAHQKLTALTAVIQSKQPHLCSGFHHRTYRYPTWIQSNSKLSYDFLSLVPPLSSSFGFLCG